MWLPALHVESVISMAKNITLCNLSRRVSPQVSSRQAPSLVQTHDIPCACYVRQPCVPLGDPRAEKQQDPSGVLYVMWDLGIEQSNIRENIFQYYLIFFVPFSVFQKLSSIRLSRLFPSLSGHRYVIAHCTCRSHYSCWLLCTRICVCKLLQDSPP